MRKSIKLIIPYFGRWPEWFDLFLESLANNPTIDFHFFTDCNVPGFIPENCLFSKIALQEYVEHAERKLGCKITVPNPYKICDLRPFFGVIHEDEIRNHQFFGWTDVDLLFGDIRSFYPDPILDRHDVLSTHADRLSGHLAILRNTPALRTIGFRIHDWQGVLKTPSLAGIDEQGMTYALTMPLWNKLSGKLGIPMRFFPVTWIKRRRLNRYYFVEQYTTPFLPKPWLDGSVDSSQPQDWTYVDGVIRNDRDGQRNCMYLHFMNFKSSRWRHDGTKAPWEGKKCCFATVEDMKSRGLRISPSGIRALT